MRRVVKTIFEGQVAIPDFEVDALISKGGSLEIIVPNDGVMSIPSYELKDRVVRRSPNSFPDQYGAGRYYLYYFGWKPNTQVRML